MGRWPDHDTFVTELVAPGPPTIVEKVKPLGETAAAAVPEIKIPLTVPVPD